MSYTLQELNFRIDILVFLWRQFLLVLHYFDRNIVHSVQRSSVHNAVGSCLYFGWVKRRLIQQNIYPHTSCKRLVQFDRLHSIRLAAVSASTSCFASSSLSVTAFRSLFKCNASSLRRRVSHLSSVRFNTDKTRKNQDGDPNTPSKIPTTGSEQSVLYVKKSQELHWSLPATLVV